MLLLLDGAVHAISQMGPDFVVLQNAISHAPTDAEIVLKIDDFENRWSVFLPSGANQNQKRVTTARLPKAAAA
jgi:hypothetical protein